MTNRTRAERVVTPESDLGPCECGSRRVRLYGETWCAAVLAKYRILHGEPTDWRTHG